MPMKTVALLAAAFLTIGWLLASTLAPPIARLQTRPDPTPRRPVADEPAPLTEQLNLRLRSSSPPPTSRRNPFEFARESTDSGRRDATPDAALEAAVTEAMPSSGSVYTLSGLGLTGEVRSAVLTDGERVYVVRVDDVIGGYTVVEITSSSVTLASDARRLTLRLAY